MMGVQGREGEELRCLLGRGMERLEICAGRKLGSTTSSGDSDLPEMRGADNGLEDVRRVGSRLKRRGHSQKEATRGDQRCKRSNGVT